MRSAREYVPKRLLIGAKAHRELADAIRSERSDIEIRGNAYTEISADDLAWADAYFGFRRPPHPTLGNVRWVHSTGAGVDPWFFPTEISPEILITRSSESFGPMIAEWALSRALAFTQHIVDLAHCQDQLRWSPRDVGQLRGSTAIVIGTGDVGTHVGRLFSAVGCTVIGVSRSGRGDASVFAETFASSALRDIVPQADWLIVTLPLTDATRKLVSKDVLRACDGAVLINAGRGAVVEESYISHAIEQGWLTGAALDVFEVEPLTTESPLWRNDRVMVSPHISGLTTNEGAVTGFFECLGDLERGEFPKWTVDRARQY